MKRRALIKKQRASSKFSRGDIIGIVFLQLAKGERMKVFHRTYERLPILILNTRKVSSNTRNEKEGFDRETTRVLKIFSRRYYWHCFSSRIEREGMKVFHRTYGKLPILVLNTKIYTTIYSTRSILLLIHEKFRQIREIKRRASIKKQRASSTKFAREDFIDIVSFREPKGMKVFHRTYGRSLNS